MSVMMPAKPIVFQETNRPEEAGPRAPSVAIGDWIRNCPAVTVDMLCEDLLVLFRSRTELDCVAVCDGSNRPIGILMKHRFFRLLGSLYGMSLFSQRTIEGLMDRNPLTVDKQVQPHSLIDRALSREEATFYDAVLVTENGRFSGVLTVSDLLHLSRQLQQDASERQIRTVRGTETMIRHIHQAIETMAEATEDSRSCSGQIESLTERGRSDLAEMLRLFRQWTDHAVLQEQAVAQLMERTVSADQIVGLIADLADQCNLLAVNATIEAARAGEHGRGFSVVAEEVRSLADQTKRSAGQINRLLKTMAEAVEDSVALARSGKQGSDRGVAQVRKTEDTFAELWQSSEWNRKAADRLASAMRETIAISGKVRQEIGMLIDQINGAK